jgi:hypothetical protein
MMGAIVSSNRVYANAVHIGTYAVWLRTIRQIRNDIEKQNVGNSLNQSGYYTYHLH